MKNNHQPSDNTNIEPASASNSSSDPPRVQQPGLSPAYLLAITLIGVFLAHVVTMLIGGFLKPMSDFWNMLLDALIMVAIVFPVVYYASFRPLLVYLRQREQALAELRHLQLELEQRVEQRTSELHQTMLSLEKEIAERRQAEAEIRTLAKFPAENPNPVMRGDKDGRVLYANPASAELMQLWNCRIGERLPDAWCQVVFDALDTGRLKEDELLCGDRVYSLVIAPIVDGGYVNIYGRDITDRKRIENLILQAKQEWERTFDAVPDLIAILDDQQNIMRLNRPMANRIGLTPQECIGLKCYQAIHGLACAPDFCPHTLTCQDGQLHVAEVHEPRLGGDFLVSTTPLIDHQGKLVGSVHVARDITEQKRAQQALRQARDELELRVQQRTEELALANLELNRTNEELLSQIAERERAMAELRLASAALEAAANGIFITGRDGVISWANPAFNQMTGYTTGEIIGQNPHFLSSGKHPPEFYREMWETILSGKVWRGETTNLRKDGSLYIEDQTITPILDAQGNITNFIAIKQEITDRKRAEQELARQNQELLVLSQVEHELREFAESLAQSTITLNSSLELEQVLVTILEQIRRVVHFTAADIILKEGRLFQVAGFLSTLDNREEWPPAAKTYSLDDFPLLDQIFSTLQPLFVTHLDGTAEWQIGAGLKWVRSYIGAPLVAAGQVFGVINLFSDQPGAFDQKAVDRLMAYTAPAAAAMQNAWLFEQVRSSREHLQALSRRLVEVQEGERRYIAGELHDEVGQALTGLTLGLQLVEKKAEDPGAVRAEVTEMNRMLEGVLEELHRLAMDLRPASLDHLGLAAALRQHVAMVNQKFGLVAKFEMVDIDQRLPPEMETALYRIVQEALNNVVRHARARRVDVILKPRHDSLLLIIEDDGVGFDPQAVLKKGERMGVFGMQERAEMLGGKLILESTAGKGTTLVVEVPYGDANSDR